MYVFELHTVTRTPPFAGCTTLAIFELCFPVFLQLEVWHAGRTAQSSRIINVIEFRCGAFAGEDRQVHEGGLTSLAHA